MPHYLNTADADFDTRFAAVLGLKREDSPDVDATVAAIIAPPTMGEIKASAMCISKSTLS